MKGYKDFYPTNRDRNHTIASILRLQAMYNISEQQFMAGRINGSNELGATLDIADCFAFVRHAIHSESYNASSNWAKATLNQLERHKRDNQSLYKENKKELLQHLSSAAYKVCIINRLILRVSYSYLRFSLSDCTGWEFPRSTKME